MKTKLEILPKMPLKETNHSPKMKNSSMIKIGLPRATAGIHFLAADGKSKITVQAEFAYRRKGTPVIDFRNRFKEQNHEEPLSARLP